MCIVRVTVKTPRRLRKELESAAAARTAAAEHRELVDEHAAELLSQVVDRRDFTMKEAAAILGISRQNAYKLLRSKGPQPEEVV